MSYIVKCCVLKWINNKWTITGMCFGSFLFIKLPKVKENRVECKGKQS